MADHGQIDLGDEVEDQITGFSGVVVAVTKWLHGCRRITIQPKKLTDGKIADTATIDEPQLTITKRAAHASTGGTGGPTPEPTRPSIPARR